MRNWFGLALLLGCALFRPDAVQSAEPSAPNEVAFQFREGLIWISVRVPQSSEPLNFLLDSGAGASVVNLGTAQRLGLKLGTKVAVQGVEANATGYWPQRLQASAADIPLPQDYLAVDLNRLSEACHCRVDGLIGADFFRSHIVQIDFAASTIRLLDSIQAAGDGQSVALKLRHHALLAPMRINERRQQWFRLDTGCATDLQWVSGKARAAERSPGGTAVGLSSITLCTDRCTVQLGATRFEEISAGLHPQSIFPGESGLLGNGLLSRFARVTIDAQAGQMILTGIQDPS